MAAQDITLTSLDGSVRLTGELISVSEDNYVLRGEFGEVQVPTAKMRCEGAACPPMTAAAKTLAIAGSDTIGEELMPLLLSGLAEAQGAAARKTMLDETTAGFSILADGGKGDEIYAATVQFKGSSTGFAGLLEETAEIGMSSRPVKPEEVELFAFADLGDPTDLAQEHAFAVDGLLVIVHPDLPLVALNSEEISGLLSGRISNWKELGGPDLAVKVFSRSEKSGTFSTVTDAILKPHGEVMSAGATILDRSDALSAAVAQEPGAIGYVGFAFKGDSKPVKLVSSCDLINDPSAFAAKTGEYPLSRRLYLYTTNKELSRPAQDLLAFATAAAAYPFVEKAGFLSYLPERRDQNGTAETIRAAIKASTSRTEVNALRELFVDLTEWDRLSTTFRFRTGSADLDNESQRDLIRLVDYLRSSPEGTEVAFVGFTDSEGPFEANRALGESRAQTIASLVADALQETGLAPSPFVVKSYGELNPVACNDDIAGQRNNRRVEVWIHH
ncbi:phosphate ABC transporter substrate-binding/OmpA family protein [Neogemmobacter tilapiae]|uniref:phosphate ABC transporter substrate-binding/OmpA family protein n=1 Tax=Neogemmobacter tilapiae TaxID=875041 RepID=UPI00167686B1|nr:phosphate ABC transporter substrate-binding/OmpA family protein [Gemmobacter tilapiae]